MVVVETHPEDVVDLRLDCPWPELAKLASTLNPSEMDDFEHGHVPYILILLKFLEQWNTTVSTPHTSAPSPLLTVQAPCPSNDERPKNVERDVDS
jgi:hypothetical protein